MLALNFDLGYGLGWKKKRQLRGYGYEVDAGLNIDNRFGEENGKKTKFSFYFFCFVV